MKKPVFCFLLCICLLVSGCATPDLPLPEANPSIEPSAQPVASPTPAATPMPAANPAPTPEPADLASATSAQMPEPPANTDGVANSPGPGAPSNSPSLLGQGAPPPAGQGAPPDGTPPTPAATENPAATPGAPATGPAITPQVFTIPKYSYLQNLSDAPMEVPVSNGADIGDSLKAVFAACPNPAAIVISSGSVVMESGVSLSFGPKCHLYLDDGAYLTIQQGAEIAFSDGSILQVGTGSTLINEGTVIINRSCGVQVFSAGESPAALHNKGVITSRTGEAYIYVSHESPGSATFTNAGKVEAGIYTTSEGANASVKSEDGTFYHQPTHKGQRQLTE